MAWVIGGAIVGAAAAFMWRLSHLISSPISGRTGGRCHIFRSSFQFERGLTALLIGVSFYKLARRRANHRLTVQPFAQKYCPFSFESNHFHGLAIPAHTEGRFAIVTNVGLGMRWTRKHDSANILRGRTTLTRTAKPCGPGAPTLASSSREASFLGMMVAKKPGHQGERGGNR